MLQTMKFILKSIKLNFSHYVNQPEKRWRQLMLGVAVFFPGVLSLYIASTFEWQWLFYLGALIMILGIAITVPAYFAILIWRLATSDKTKGKTDK